MASSSHNTFDGSNNDTFDQYFDQQLDQHFEQAFEKCSIDFGDQEEQRKKEKKNLYRKKS